jgi:ribonuclease T2
MRFVTSTAFDFFVFATSWQPEECYNQPSYHGCENPKENWLNELTIHGMWPQYINGSWPSFCSNEAFNSSIIYNDLQTDDFYEHWPNIKYDIPDNTQELAKYASFWEHEWTKHGTCSGLDQISYFKTTLDNRPTTPKIISDNYGKTVKKQDMIDAYGHIVVPVCVSNYLSQIYTCIKPSTYRMFDCPESVILESNCDDNIMIEMFQ